METDIKVRGAAVLLVPLSDVAFIHSLALFKPRGLYLDATNSSSDSQDLV